MGFVPKRSLKCRRKSLRAAPAPPKAQVATPAPGETKDPACAMESHAGLLSLVCGFGPFDPLRGSLPPTPAKLRACALDSFYVW